MRRRILKMAGLGLLAAGLWAQTAPIEQPDAERTREAFSQMLQRYPPALRGIFELDPSLLTSQAYMTPYPALVNFLAAHPEVARNPAYFVGREGDRFRMDRAGQASEIWRNVFSDVGVFLGFGMAIGLLTWLIRTLIDYRRWIRLAKVQTDVHTKLMDRFTANEELLSYMQSPAGSKFLQSAPISLDAGTKTLGAPLGRIIMSLQAGLVLAAGGVGLQVAAGRIAEDISQPLHVLGILSIALGIGFVASAAVSFLISQRLGLLEKANVS